MRGTSLGVEHTRDMEGDDRYYMRRMKEILEAFPNKAPPFYPVQLCSHMYIGNQRNADDIDDLQRLGITHVLNCAGTRKFDLSKSPYPKSSGIVGYLMIPAEDHDQYDIMQHFAEAISFLDKCKKMGGKAFVHCNLGVNRSGAICAAYLMTYEKKPLLEVITHLKNKRQFILCNKNFRRQLIRYARCRSLLDSVIDTSSGDQTQSNSYSSRKGRFSRSNSASNDCNNKDNNNYSRSVGYSTNSLDRANFNRHQHTSGEDQSEQRRSSRSSFLSSQNYKNQSTRLDHHTSNGNNNSFQLESVPERKPICDFIPSRSKYDPHLGEPQPAAPTSSSAPATPKSVTFRRPTVSDISEDGRRVRSSPSASPKLGFLSRIGTKITRQRSLTNISRTPSLTDDEPPEDTSKHKRSSLRSKESSTPNQVPAPLSTSRPLRVYKRSSTDTELYRKPSSIQTYRRAETIATTDPELEKSSSACAAVVSTTEELLPHEFRYHSQSQYRPSYANFGLSSTSQPSSSSTRRESSSTRRESSSSRRESNTTINLLARLKPVSRSNKSSNKTNLPLS